MVRGGERNIQSCDPSEVLLFRVPFEIVAPPAKFSCNFQSVWDKLFHFYPMDLKGYRKPKATRFDLGYNWPRRRAWRLRRINLHCLHPNLENLTNSGEVLPINIDHFWH
jgi:hypothetical protein